MPKMKTHKGTKNRFKVSATGKVKFKKSFTGHLMSGKSGDRCRRGRKASYVTGPLAKKIRLALGQA
jgi:large subunit ribosomal protein L35